MGKNDKAPVGAIKATGTVKAEIAPDRVICSLGGDHVSYYRSGVHRATSAQALAIVSECMRLYAESQGWRVGARATVRVAGESYSLGVQCWITVEAE